MRRPTLRPHCKRAANLASCTRNPPAHRNIRLRNTPAASVASLSQPQADSAADEMSGVRRKRSSSRRRTTQLPTTRRSPSPHHLRGCYERGLTDGICEGIYDKGRQDGYQQGMNAHYRQDESDDDENGEKPSWRTVRRGRNDDSGSSDSNSSSSEDSEVNSTSGSEDSEDEGDDKRTREQIYEEIAQLENELAELEASDQEDRPHPTDG